VAAARWAERDMLAADVGLHSYTPPVVVFVGCKNEELVVDGMVTALLALDYPADRLTLVVVDDGSDDSTGSRLDAWAAREPRLRVLHRPPGSGGGTPTTSRTRWRCAGWSGTSATRSSAR
jgi:cellulose synthase/poly-beta-1,6-N-acetylglucosamine synthase-like glycosyltransferase